MSQMPCVPKFKEGRKRGWEPKPLTSQQQARDDDTIDKAWYGTTSAKTDNNLDSNHLI